MIEEWRHFCECINFGKSNLDARAIQFMNNFEFMLLGVNIMICDKRI